MSHNRARQVRDHFLVKKHWQFEDPITSLFDEPDIRRFPIVYTNWSTCLFHIRFLMKIDEEDNLWTDYLAKNVEDVLVVLCKTPGVAKTTLSLQSKYRSEGNEGYKISDVVLIQECILEDNRAYLVKCASGTEQIMPEIYSNKQFRLGEVVYEDYRVS